MDLSGTPAPGAMDVGGVGGGLGGEGGGDGTTAMDSDYLEPSLQVRCVCMCVRACVRVCVRLRGKAGGEWQAVNETLRKMSRCVCVWGMGGFSERFDDPVDASGRGVAGWSEWPTPTIWMIKTSAGPLSCCGD